LLLLSLSTATLRALCSLLLLLLLLLLLSRQRRLGIWAYSLIVLASVIFWFASLSDCSRAAFQYHGLPATEVRASCCCCGPHCPPVSHKTAHDWFTL
jgi:hypothetical protein